MTRNHNPFIVHPHKSSYLFQLHFDELLSGEQSAKDMNSTLLNAIMGSLLSIAFCVQLLILIKSRQKVKLVRDEISWGETYNFLTLYIIRASDALICISMLN